MFSKTCEYAIRSCVYIASQTFDGKRVGLVDVSEQIHSPEAFTSKILQKLVKAGIIKSIKGPGGGFVVNLSKIDEIKLKMIVEVFEGNVLFRCSLGLNECSDTKPCPFHHLYKPAKEKLIDIYSTTSLGDLLKVYREGMGFLRL